MFTARYAMSSYIKVTGFFCKALKYVTQSFYISLARTKIAFDLLVVVRNSDTSISVTGKAKMYPIMCHEGRESVGTDITLISPINGERRGD